MKWMRMAVALVVVLTAWAVGNLHGQGKVSEFKISVIHGANRVSVMCDAGCDRAWRVDAPCPRENLAAMTQGRSILCRSQYDQNGRIEPATP